MFYVAIVDDFDNGMKFCGAYHEFDIAKEAINEWFGDDYYCEDNAWNGTGFNTHYYYYEGISHECVGVGIIYKVDKII